MKLYNLHDIQITANQPTDEMAKERSPNPVMGPSDGFFFFFSRYCIIVMCNNIMVKVLVCNHEYFSMYLSYT